MKKVCVIGAGAAGLAAIKHINSSAALTGTCYELSGTVGGVWVYNSKTGLDGFGLPIHSVMYQDMRTNLPKEIMGFLDFPFQRGETSFVSHREVSQYLREYADHFQLWSSIQFYHQVTGVKPIFSQEGQGKDEGGEDSKDEGRGVGGGGIDGEEEERGKEGDESRTSQPQWLVTVRDLKQNKDETHKFDSVMVCNGHFCKPFIPDIVNIEAFQGEVLHSRDYRSPQVFANKRVVVLGCGPSGVDISLEIAQVATEVIISFRNPPIPLPSVIRQVDVIKSARCNGFVFEDNQECDCDVLILCSGYLYDYPFLSPQCGVMVDGGKQVLPLYKHMIHTKYPNLCFLGIPIRVAPFHMFDIQVRFFVKYLQGYFQVPSEKAMNRDLAEDVKLRRRMELPLSQSHHLGSEQWEYYQFLAEQAGFAQELKPVVRKIYEHTGERRKLFPQHYKDDRVSILDSDHYEYVETALNTD